MTATAPAKGWAVAVKGEFDIATVSPTRRAAIVNWLHLNDQPVLHIHSDKEIEAMWERAAKAKGALIFSVWISEGQ